MTPVRTAGHLSVLTGHSDAQLARMAVVQHLVLSLEELRGLGLSRSAVAKRTSAGRLHRVHTSVYAIVPSEALTAHGRYHAAVLACTGSRHAAALSHRSAADLHGLRASRRRTIEVIVPGRCTHRHAGIQVHRSVNLAEADIEAVDGIRVTTVARTLLDLAAVVPVRVLERALDQAEILRVFDFIALSDQLRRNPCHPGAGGLRKTLGAHHAGSTVTESQLEEAFFAFCRAGEIPLPEINRHVNLGDGGTLIRPDAIWREQHVAVELDGERFHLTRRAFQEDRIRDQRLVAAGWRVIRTTWRQLTERPHELAAVLGRLFATERAAPD
jgi:hypothetical protein